MLFTLKNFSMLVHAVGHCLFRFNTLRSRQNCRHFADDIFKCIFMNENVWISLKISLEFVPKIPMNNIPSLVQIMAWRRSGDKPLSEPMMVSLLTHICVTRLQWVKWSQSSGIILCMRPTNKRRRYSVQDLKMCSLIATFQDCFLQSFHPDKYVVFCGKFPMQHDHTCM